VVLDDLLFHLPFHCVRVSQGEAAVVENALAEGAKPTKKSSKAKKAAAAAKEQEGGDKAGTSTGSDKEAAPAAKKDKQQPHKVGMHADHVDAGLPLCVAQLLECLNCFSLP
jgi:hypothetical protein